MKKFLILFIIYILWLITPVQAINISQDYKLDYLNIRFWNNFNDDCLIENLYKLYNNNNDLKAASLKVNQAQRIVKMSLANELPTLGFNGYVGHIFSSSDEVFGKITIDNYTESHFLLPLTFNYEIDIWGKNHLKTKSKKKQLEKIKQDEKAAYIALTSAFAVDYYNLIKIDRLIELQKELIETQNHIVNSVEKKYELGTAAINQVIQEQKTLTYLNEELNNLLEKQDVLQNQMNVLLADKNFSTVQRKSFTEIQPVIVIPESINPDIIEARPDYIKSELNLKKIGIDVKIAKKEFLPTFNIVGNLGFNWYNLYSANPFLSNIGIAPSFDIFAGGRKVQYLKLQKDEYKIGLEHYSKTILKSIQETNDTLYTLKTIDKKYNIAKDRLNLCIQDYHLGQKRSELGTADKVQVLYQKENELIAQKQETSLKINEIIAMINLYQALGGTDFILHKI